ncbi:Uncharacterised protein [Porphyromonas cangingivalis]|uniref:Uncharacterized protein n=1 Tax=Porphyromonas cangingivalis TaxID=36874 RepID=A0A1T4KXH7_PORCN|nr:hypothetical protein SAMN02745205_00901 [Porphyromonas cangingivalis]VEJ04062.1 Uncharacterised protein [Porphyromonas cangingivalis]
MIGYSSMPIRNRQRDKGHPRLSRRAVSFSFMVGVRSASELNHHDYRITLDSLRTNTSRCGYSSEKAQTRKKSLRSIAKVVKIDDESR